MWKYLRGILDDERGRGGCFYSFIVLLILLRRRGGGGREEDALRCLTDLSWNLTQRLKAARLLLFLPLWAFIILLLFLWNFMSDTSWSQNHKCRLLFFPFLVMFYFKQTPLLLVLSLLFPFLVSSLLSCPFLTSFSYCSFPVSFSCFIISLLFFCPLHLYRYFPFLSPR